MKVPGVVSSATVPSLAIRTGIGWPALQKVKGFQGVKLGHKVTIKGGWERGKGPTAELLIERYGKLEIGDEVHSTFYLMLEGTQRVMRAKYPSG